MEAIHVRYDPVLGPGIVNVLERLGAFAIFKSPVFGVGLVVLVMSIVVCTLDRTPKAVAGRVRGPGRPARAILRSPAARSRGDDGRGRRRIVGRVIRSRGFHVSETSTDDGTAYIYGDRHQYTKLATLFTHLGLILFLVAAAGHLAVR